MDGMTTSRAGDAVEERLRIRRGEFAGPTAGLAPGYVQANLVILPGDLAHDFLRFAQANPLGLVLNFAERDEETFGGYGYGQSFIPQPGSILHG